jgi:hypothetical protein
LYWIANPLKSIKIEHVVIRCYFRTILVGMLRSPVFSNFKRSFNNIFNQQNFAIVLTEILPQKRQHQLAIKYSEIADSLNHSKNLNVR